MGLRSVRHDMPEQSVPPPAPPVVSRAPQAAAPVVSAPVPPAPIRRADGPAASAQSAMFPARAPALIPALSTEPFTAPILPADDKRRLLVAMDDKEVRGCTRCGLSQARTHTVFGEGDADALLMFIGEGPGETEDNTGRPFVGRAGEMLNKWIAAMGLRREQVYIANIVKCRPPGNRVPAPDEVVTCTPFLERQIEIIRPKVIVTLGLPATQHMIQEKVTMGRVRGTWKNFRGIRLMPTFHPAYVLRQYTSQTRAAVWNDLQMVMQELGLPIPKISS